jgi:hypothetical protein
MAARKRVPAQTVGESVHDRSLIVPHIARALDQIRFFDAAVAPYKWARLPPEDRPA